MKSLPRGGGDASKLSDAWSYATRTMSFYRFILFALLFVVRAIRRSYSESLTCLTVYKEGGAPAVFQSPKCPRWSLPNHDASLPRRSQAGRCQSAVRQGRRNSQEDRTLCALDIIIPFPGQQGSREVKVGIVAVFDGHNGAEASEMASKLLLEYFTLHAYFLLDKAFSILAKKSMGYLPNGKYEHPSRTLKSNEELGQLFLDGGRFKFTMSAIFDGSFQLEVLKESLLRAIDDIDATFSKEAHRKGFISGSTAAVVLIFDGQILVANVGDSKAFVCSETFQTPLEAKATMLRLYTKKRRDGVTSPIKGYRSFKLNASNGFSHFSVKELTRDHHPDRDDERSRVESAGGYVLEWGGVPRVNGQLAVSRSIGDVPFKSSGVISIPEVTDWQCLTANNSYLVAASDGVFEKMSPQDVCDLLWELGTQSAPASELSFTCPYSMADCIVDAASEKGSMDNMAAVVVPFVLTEFSETLMKKRFDEGMAAKGLLNCIDKHSADRNTSNLVQLEHANPVIGKFGRLLVEGRNSSFGCFYLSENLDETNNYAFWLQRNDQEIVVNSPHALSNVLDHSCGPLDWYVDHNLCLPFGISNGGDRDQSTYSDSFTSFLGFLESIPFNMIDSNRESQEHPTLDSRYILNKRFDRGSYGEVWMAFHWNCSHGSDTSYKSIKNRAYPFNTFHLGPDDENLKTSSIPNDCSSGPPDDNIFILKRIMVEKGTSVYLSGLREKYFGEVFLNASTFLRGSLKIGNSEPSLEEVRSDCLLKTNESVVREFENQWTSENTSQRIKRDHGLADEEGLNHIARYIESFESRSNEIWLVFRHEGVSLSKLLYTVEMEQNDTGGASDEHMKRLQVLRPSEWWHWLKTTENGQVEMRNLLRQLLMALKSCHDRNITHRDIKPENMIICFENLDSGKCLKGIPSGDENYTTKMRIIDFGSAMDEFTMKELYGSNGPSRAEQTYEYMPPEAYLNSSWYQGPTSITKKYDMWTVGVVILEMIIGSPNVFTINGRMRSLLDQYLEGWNEGLKGLAYRLRAFMELCILIPGSSTKHCHTRDSNGQRSGSPASWKCSEEFFALQIKNLDPLKIGFPNVWALRLVRQLLVWNPVKLQTYFAHPLKI